MCDHPSHVLFTRVVVKNQLFEFVNTNFINQAWQKICEEAISISIRVGGLLAYLLTDVNDKLNNETSGPQLLLSVNGGFGEETEVD